MAGGNPKLILRLRHFSDTTQHNRFKSSAPIGKPTLPNKPASVFPGTTAPTHEPSGVNIDWLKTQVDALHEWAVVAER